MSTDEPERWQPDPALVFTVRTRSIAIAGLSGMDRSWIVAALTVEGWTVSSIAARLQCSLRLVQQIKAEPMTKVALYALTLQRRLTEAEGLRHLEGRLASQQIAARDASVLRLTRQRDTLLDQLVQLQKENRRAADTTADYGR